MSAAPVLNLAEDIDASYEELRAVDDPKVLCVALKEIRQLIRALKLMDDDLSDRIVEVLHGSYEEVDGVGIVEIRRGSTRKAWDHELLLPMVVARALDERHIDLDTGEALETEADAVVRGIKECAGISYWKVTGLRARGLDPDEFCETSQGRKQVILP